MEKYFYTKSGVNSEVLTEAICLRTSLRKVFIGVSISEKISTETNNIFDDNIEIQFSRALTSIEQDEITNLINMIGPMYDLMIRKNIELNTMNWALKTGQELMAQFGANNLYRQKTPQQIVELITNYSELINSLLTGSLQTAYGVFSTMHPDANISQEEIDEFKLRLEIVLGV